MKIKLMSVLTGAVVLTFAATPFAVKAVTVTSTPSLLAQTTPQAQQSKFANLNLTQQQREQIRQIHEETRKKIEAVLTPQQVQQYKTAIQNRRTQRQNSNTILDSASQGQAKRQSIFSALNLTKDQKNQIRQIMQSARSRMNGILTDAQRTQLQQVRGASMRSRTQ